MNNQEELDNLRLEEENNQSQDGIRRRRRGRLDRLPNVDESYMIEQRNRRSNRAQSRMQGRDYFRNNALQITENEMEDVITDINNNEVKNGEDIFEQNGFIKLPIKNNNIQQEQEKDKEEKMDLEIDTNINNIEQEESNKEQSPQYFFV